MIHSHLPGGPRFEGLESRFLLNGGPLPAGAADLDLVGARLVRDADFYYDKPDYTEKGARLQVFVKNTSASSSVTLTDYAIDGVSHVDLPTESDGAVDDVKWWMAWPETLAPGEIATLRVRLVDVDATLGTPGSTHSFTVEDSTGGQTTFQIAPEPTDLWMPYVHVSDSLDELTVYAGNQGPAMITLPAGGGVEVNDQAVTGVVADSTLAPGQASPITISLASPLTAGEHVLVEITDSAGGETAIGSFRALPASYGVTLWQYAGSHDSTDLAEHYIDTDIPGQHVFQDEPYGPGIAPQDLADAIVDQWTAQPTQPVMTQLTWWGENMIYADMADVAMTHRDAYHQDLTNFLTWPKPIWYLPQNAWGRMENTTWQNEKWYRLEDLQRQAYDALAHGAKQVQWFTTMSLWEQGYGRGGGYDPARLHQDFYMPASTANPVAWDRIGRISAVAQTLEGYLADSFPFGRLDDPAGVEVSTVAGRSADQAVVFAVDRATPNDYWFESAPSQSKTTWTNLTISAKVPAGHNYTHAYWLDPFGGVTEIAMTRVSPETVLLTLPELDTAAAIVLGEAADGAALSADWADVEADLADYGDTPTDALTVPAADVIPAETTVPMPDATDRTRSIDVASTGAHVAVATGKDVILADTYGQEIWQKTFDGRVFFATFSRDGDRLYVAANLTDVEGVNYEDVHILCYDLSGAEQWRHFVGRTVFDLQASLADNGVTYGEWNGLGVRLDEAGQVVWSESVSWYATRVQPLADGGAIIQGPNNVLHAGPAGQNLGSYWKQDSNPVTASAAGDDGDLVAYGGSRLTIYDDGVQVAQPYVGRQLRSIDISAAGDRIAAGTLDGTFAMYDASGGLLWRKVDRTSIVTQVGFLPDGSGVAAQREVFAYTPDDGWQFRDELVAYDAAGNELWRHEGAWRDQPFMNQFALSEVFDLAIVGTGSEVRIVDLTDPAVDNGYLYSVTTDPLPVGWQSADVGSGSDGSARLSPLHGSVTISAASGDIGSAGDSMHYVYTTLAGDGEVVARVKAAEGTMPYSKAGVMIRSSLDADAPHASMLMVPRQPNVLSSVRRYVGYHTEHRWGGPDGQSPWLKVIRTGNVFTAQQSDDGVNWSTVWTTTVPSLSGAVLAGLAVSNDDAGGRHEALFDHVTLNGQPLEAPAADELGPRVDAGRDTSVDLAHGAELEGAAVDDGQPAALTTTWRKLSGPGDVAFGDAASPATSATFTEAGTYVLQLEADDGATVVTDEVTLTVSAQPAATPTISPGGSMHVGPVAVVLDTATDGATIRYTLDGSIPTEASPVYDGSLVLTGRAVVTARAFSPVHLPSEAVTRAYTIVSQPNLLTNGSFETDVDSPIGYPDGWTYKAPGSQDTQVYYSGNASIRQTWPLTWGNYDYAQQNIAIQPSTEYVLSGYIKTEITSGQYSNVMIRFAPVPTPGSYNSPSIHGTTDWTKLSVTFTSEAVDPGGRVDILWEFGEGDVAWFDDIYLGPIGGDLDSASPRVAAASRAVGDRPDQWTELRLRMTEDVADALDDGDLQVVDTVTGQPVDTSSATVSFDPAANEAVWDLSGVNLPAGHYTAMVSAGSLTDAQGNPLDGDGDGIGGDDWSMDVHVALGGDANLDGAVDVGDLGILAGHWGMADGADWSQGDFTGDGAVDVGDLGILAGGWGQQLTPPPATTALGDSPAIPSPGIGLEEPSSETTTSLGDVEATETVDVLAAASVMEGSAATAVAADSPTDLAGLAGDAPAEMTDITIDLLEVPLT